MNPNHDEKGRFSSGSGGGGGIYKMAPSGPKQLSSHAYGQDRGRRDVKEMGRDLTKLREHEGKTMSRRAKFSGVAGQEEEYQEALGRHQIVERRLNRVEKVHKLIEMGAGERYVTVSRSKDVSARRAQQDASDRRYLDRQRQMNAAELAKKAAPWRGLSAHDEGKAPKRGLPKLNRLLKKQWKMGRTFE